MCTVKNFCTDFSIKNLTLLPRLLQLKQTNQHAYSEQIQSGKMQRIRYTKMRSYLSVHYCHVFVFSHTECCFHFIDCGNQWYKATIGTSGNLKVTPETSSYVSQMLTAWSKVQNVKKYTIKYCN